MTRARRNIRIWAAVKVAGGVADDALEGGVAVLLQLRSRTLGLVLLLPSLIGQSAFLVPPLPAALLLFLLLFFGWLDRFW